MSPGFGLSLFTVIVVTISEVGVTFVTAGVEVTGVLLPSVPGVAVVTLAVLLRLPVVVLLTVPLSKTLVLEPDARSGNVTLPVHGFHVAPLSRLYCGFSIASGILSLTEGVFAVDGPSLITVTA